MDWHYISDVSTDNNLTPSLYCVRLVLASHADVLRLVTRSSLRTSAWEASLVLASLFFEIALIRFSD